MKETERGSRGKVAGCGVVGESRGAAQTVCEEGWAFQKQTQSLRLGVRIHCFVRIAFRTTVIVLHSLPTRCGLLVSRERICICHLIFFFNIT